MPVAFADRNAVLPSPLMPVMVTAEGRFVPEITLPTSPLTKLAVADEIVFWPPSR